MESNKFDKFEKKIGVKFGNSELLKQVFVHRSYLNENPSFNLDHNERLEFLGDAVLELIVTEYLYLNFPNPEGDLTNWRSSLVKGEMLSNIAQKLEIEDYLFLSKGESQSTGKARQIILANCFEALIGAIYLDKNYQTAQKFINKNLLIHLKNILENKLYRDAKSSLQELAQEKLNITPHYIVLNENGPDHNKHFTIGVYIGERLLGQGEGFSKQSAEQDAALNALNSNLI